MLKRFWTLEHAAGTDGDGMHRVVVVVHHDGVALRDAALRGSLARGVERDHRPAAPPDLKNKQEIVNLLQKNNSHP
uniref:Uncharacterized protein n=1 Tax=Arundo donax TaxID=35708 RepID=A0A0A9DY97_ARUDO